MTTVPPDPTSERGRAIQAIQQAGLLRPVSAELVKRYVYLTPEQRAKVREELAKLRFDPPRVFSVKNPLSEQIIRDRGER